MRTSTFSDNFMKIWLQHFQSSCAQTDKPKKYFFVKAYILPSTKWDINLNSSLWRTQLGLKWWRPMWHEQVENYFMKQAGIGVALAYFCIKYYFCFVSRWSIISHLLGMVFSLAICQCTFALILVGRIWLNPSFMIAKRQKDQMWDSSLSAIPDWVYLQQNVSSVRCLAGDTKIGGIGGSLRQNEKTLRANKFLNLKTIWE